MFTLLRRWLMGDDTTATRNIIQLEDIPTWTDLYGENKKDFANTLCGIPDSPQYAEDPEINRKVSFFGANMTSLKVDGIVRSTDTSLTSNDGISGAISNAAGPRLNAVLKNLGGCEEGEAKTTLGFDLPARYIVHTVGSTQSDILERCYKSCLEQMKLKKMKSLAFCCISTGIHGFRNDEAVLIALKTVRVWLEGLKTENKLDEIDRIVFCLFSDEDLLLYSIWMQIFFPSTYEPDPPSTETRAQNSLASSPEEEAANDIESIQLEQEGQQVLRPLQGYIELTTEPDMITLDDDPTTKRARMPCGHVIGPESMTDYFRDNLNNGEYKFICPTPKCNREWEYFLVRHVACLTKKEMCEFEQKLERNFLEKQRGNQLCPGCKTWCFRDPRAGNCVRCQICTQNRGKKFDFCWSCAKEWKRFLSFGSCGNTGCDGKDKQFGILANCPTKWINLCPGCPTIRACPKCGLLIEHQKKCAHVCCRNCRCKFCFVCLKLTEDGKAQCNFLGTCKLAPRQLKQSGR